MESDLRRARHRLAFLDHSELISGSGSWEWIPDRGELSWSDNHYRLYGLEPGEIVPSPQFVLGQIHKDDRVRIKRVLDAVIAGGQLDRALEYRILAVDGTARTLRMTVAAFEPGEGVPRTILGSVQDVSSVRRTDRQLAAHDAVTLALDHWSALQQGARELLERIAAAMEVPFGAFWVPEGGTLTARAIWHGPSPELEAVATATRQWRPGHGDATIGRGFEGRQPVISAQPSEGGSIDRRAAIERAGLRGALAIPAVFVDETLAVLELLSADPIQPSERLGRALHGIGHEIGHFLSHRQGDLDAPVLTARGLEVLQLAAWGHTAADIARELYLSPATVKRHFERAYAALGVSDRTAAVAEAMRRGLVT